jgi:hypothetical protein
MASLGGNGLATSLSVRTSSRCAFVGCGWAVQRARGPVTLPVPCARMQPRKNTNSTDMALELDMMDVEQPLVADTDFPRRSLLREHRTWWSLVAFAVCLGIVAGALEAVGRPFVDLCMPVEQRCDYTGESGAEGGGGAGKGSAGQGSVPSSGLEGGPSVASAPVPPSCAPRRHQAPFPPARSHGSNALLKPCPCTLTLLCASVRGAAQAAWMEPSFSV